MKKLGGNELVINRSVRIPREIHERIMDDPAWRHLMDTKLLAPRCKEPVEQSPAIAPQDDLARDAT